MGINVYCIMSASLYSHIVYRNISLICYFISISPTWSHCQNIALRTYIFIWQSYRILRWRNEEFEIGAHRIHFSVTALCCGVVSRVSSSYLKLIWCVCVLWSYNWRYCYAELSMRSFAGFMFFCVADDLHTFARTHKTSGRFSRRSKAAKLDIENTAEN